MVDVKKNLENCGALLEGHFLLTSGKHSDGYVQCAKLLMYPDIAEESLKPVVEKVKDLKIDVVVGPAMGGIVVSYEIARQLGVPSMFTERQDDVMTLRRGFTLEKGTRVLVVEDVVTTGKSSLEAVEAIKDYEVEIVAIATLVNRSGGDKVGDYPLYGSIDLDIKTYEADGCPMCQRGEEIVKPGSRKKI